MIILLIYFASRMAVGTEWAWLESTIRPTWIGQVDQNWGWACSNIFQCASAHNGNMRAFWQQYLMLTHFAAPAWLSLIRKDWIDQINWMDWVRLELNRQHEIIWIRLDFQEHNKFISFSRQRDHYLITIVSSS